MKQKPAFQIDKGVSEVARKAGCSVSTASKKLLAGKTPEQIISEAQAWKDKQARKQSAPEPTELSETLAHAQQRKEIALANIRELELSQAREELVERASVERDAFKTSRIIRDGLLTIPDRLAAILAAETNPSTIHAVLSEEIRQVLVSTSNALNESQQ